MVCTNGNTVYTILSNFIQLLSEFCLGICVYAYACVYHISFILKLQLLGFKKF